MSGFVALLVPTIPAFTLSSVWPRHLLSTSVASVTRVVSAKPTQHGRYNLATYALATAPLPSSGSCTQEVSDLSPSCRAVVVLTEASYMMRDSSRCCDEATSGAGLLIGSDAVQADAQLVAGRPINGISTLLDVLSGSR